MWHSVYQKKNRAHITATNKEWKKNNTERCLFQAAKQRSKSMGLEFNIELSDIIIPEICPILEVPLIRNDPNKRYSPSIDRKDSNQGYIKGNIQIISSLSNRMKSNATKDELQAFCKNAIHTL